MLNAIKEKEINISEERLILSRELLGWFSKKKQMRLRGNLKLQQVIIELVGMVRR